MEPQKHTISFLFFVAMLLAVDVVTASSVTTKKRLREEKYSRVWLKKSMMRDGSSRRRLSPVEDGKVDVCADIVGWSDWYKPKQESSPCPKLTVSVRRNTGFFEFVELNEQDEVEGGFSIAIFCHVLHLLPFNVQPIFKLGKISDTVDQFLQKIKIEGQNCEAAVGDFTVRANRTQYVDFTSPYLSSEVYILVPAESEWNQTFWTFLKPFTWRLWVTIVGICIYIGLAVAILEYRVGNPKFRAPFHRNVLMVIWFPISTIYFIEGKLHNKNSKVVLVMWLSMIYIIVQMFTASLSAWLTLNQMQPRLPSSYEHVGYPDGTFLRQFLIDNYRCNDKNLVPLKSSEDYKNALSNGSVNVIFDNQLNIQFFLDKYGSNYMKFGPINQESIAFAFAHESPLLQNFSRAVIKFTESNTMMDLKKKYLKFGVPNGSQPNQPLPQSLDIRSFIGLFGFIMTLTIVVIICSEISLRRKNSKIEPVSTE